MAFTLLLMKTMTVTARVFEVVTLARSCGQGGEAESLKIATLGRIRDSSKTRLATMKLSKLFRAAVTQSRSTGCTNHYVITTRSTLQAPKYGHASSATPFCSDQCREHKNQPIGIITQAEESLQPD